MGINKALGVGVGGVSALSDKLHFWIGSRRTGSNSGASTMDAGGAETVGTMRPGGGGGGGEVVVFLPVDI